MGTYILMTRLTAQGGQTLHENPGRVNEVNEEIADFGCSVVAQYATLGRYDFITIIEAPDEMAVAHLVVHLSARGTVKIEASPAIRRADFVRRLQGPKNPDPQD